MLAIIGPLLPCLSHAVSRPTANEVGARQPYTGYIAQGHRTRAIEAGLFTDHPSVGVSSPWAEIISECCSEKQ